MNKLSFTIKSAIVSIFFLVSVSPTFAIAPNRIGKPSITPVKAVMRSCQARESATKKRMTQLSALVSTMFTTFDKIADRVKSYYSNTVLPSGKTVSNYDALVNDIAAKKVLVQTALDKAQSDINAFNCTTGNPITLMNTFRVDMQNVKTALKNYRTSIRNLIVAIRSVGGDMETTPTPTPSVSI